MATGRITKRSVDALQPAASDQFLWDDELGGFGLRLTTKGARSYVFQYRLGGRGCPARRYTIGRHGAPWTPESARTRAKALKQMVDQGIDPVEADKERQRQAVDLAFRSYAETFIDRYLKPNWKKWDLAASMLRREVVPVLGNKPLPSIRRGDLNSLWDRLDDRPAAKRFAYATLRKLFRWAVDRDDIERSPLEGAEAPAAGQARDHVLSDAELPIIWRAAGTLGEPLTAFYRLLIVTMQRREEVSGMDWAELDRPSAMWTLSGARTKNGQPQLVPLNSLAIETLDALAGGTKWPKRGPVITTNGKTSISGYSKAKARLDVAVAATDGGDEVRPWRIHDLRRTGATGLQRLGVRFEVTEAVLNHVSGARSGVAGIYQRHDWKDEKRAALDAWGSFVGGLLQPAATENLIRLADHR